MRCICTKCGKIHQREFLEEPCNACGARVKKADDSFNSRIRLIAKKLKEEKNESQI